ncbi:site-specific DNA-methyltransferase [Bacillus amyloliquefaciens]|uniref:DNA-methyltransferase n=2 Tax=Bacillaceae TaxID=186817 RepID=UPI001CA3E785|nr:site-specific DNA-methyltransferase [Bacillus amyloliquefaciens]QZY10974.1 site-specific DNA-methyltransferase [Bacillus amyloliquefaciens]
MIGELEVNRIYQRDCIEGMKMLPDNSVDLIIADPPYGIDFNSNFRKSSELKSAKGILNDGKNNSDFLAQVLLEVDRVLKPNSHVYWFTRWDRIYSQQPLIERHFKTKNAIVWMKNNWSMGDLSGAYAAQYETILFAQKGRRSLNEVNGKKRHTDILQFDRISPNKLLHSHEKPASLIEFLIKKSSNEGDTILDPFCGSGTTAASARKLNRNFITFELEREYVEIANKRLDSVIPGSALKEDAHDK